MSDYAIGDVQGCYDSLLSLLKKINFNKDKDRLFFLGDVINRGNKSLETIQFIYNNKDNCHLVLGNHDIHLLVCAYNKKLLHKTDTISEILNAPDKNKILNFLRKQKIIIAYDKNTLLVHAGIPPQWDRQQALEYSKQASDYIKGDNYHNLLKNLYGNYPDKWCKNLSGFDKLRYIFNALTRMRLCTKYGQLNLRDSEYNNNQDFMAWFEHNNRKTKDQNIIFGHWASLPSNIKKKNIYPLDAGCVWGRELSAIRISDKKIFSISCSK